MRFRYPLLPIKTLGTMNAMATPFVKQLEQSRSHVFASRKSEIRLYCLFRKMTDLSAMMRALRTIFTTIAEHY